MVKIEEEIREVIAESNGDQFWHRKFDYHESLERVSSLERRGIEFQVKVGLELLRVKRQQLKHGQFIAYLVNAGFVNTDTPDRRLKVGRQYMTYLGLIESPKLINPPESEVLKALEIAYSENPQFADFHHDRKANPDVNDFYDKMYPSYHEEVRSEVDPYKLIGFNIYEVANRIEKKWHSMTPTEQVDTYLLLRNFLSQLKAVLSRWKDFIPEIETELKSAEEQGKVAEQHSNVLGGIKTEDLEVDPL